jgi:hypothetical protein
MREEKRERKTATKPVTATPYHRNVAVTVPDQVPNPGLPQVSSLLLIP